MNSRRSFVLGAAGAVSLVAGKASANSRVRVAVLGVNGRGTDHIRGFNALPNAEVVMLCDPDRNLLAERAEQFETKYHRKVQTEQDLRKVFDNKEIDAVSIATPNHWHALAAIWACQAGKDVYVEKPGAHNIYEGRKLIEAAHRYNRIVQHGVQLRSSEAIKEAVQLMNKGVIGKVYMARGLVFRWRPSVGHKGNEPTPEYLNWDIWQGPAEERAGNLAAGTSTGGTQAKRWGRVGDSPIIGAGTYASHQSCAVSATGTGEYFIRLPVAREGCNLVFFKCMTGQQAADEVIHKELEGLHGDGGLIAIT